MDTSTFQFFHMSTQAYSVGDELCGNGRDKVDPRIENELEARKPDRALSRRDALFSLEHTDFTLCGIAKSCYIYQIRPNGEPQRWDLTWIGEMQKALIKLKYSQYEKMNRYADWTPELVEKCCLGYWSGAATKTPNWEFLMKSCTVVQVIASELVDPKTTKGGWPLSITIS
jgi:hypothetical protein